MTTNFPLNRFGGWIVPDSTTIPDNTTIPDWSELGSDCTLGPYCTLGSDCELGAGCTLGADCKLGSYCMLGSDCKLEGVVAIRWLNLSNVDGSGRDILVIQHKDGILIRAGCFLGELENFTARARKEEKHVYVAVLTGVVKALESLPAQTQP